ncbi:cellulose biosynthesis protein BcsQ [Pseudomonas sp. LS1212]|uniref:cellulose biosynthesis protein BcsQ n=1 Tax=Pseudomonas sp. LS1212 TaxID=2972478 RepID=UPI00215BEAD0|nr:cellulose biosynthesis protein BcsQ [Pseudomonas sp. LS1212]UVJ44160.1 cellulose biosynthesis protein BcsQ [Pseudomonas sp. LS1212]
MTRADDIANLFNRFGASADSYLEVEPVYNYLEEEQVEHAAHPAVASVPSIASSAHASGPAAPRFLRSSVAQPPAVNSSAEPPAQAEPAAVAIAVVPVAAIALEKPAPAPLHKLLADLAKARKSEAIARNNAALENSLAITAPPDIKARIIALVSTKGGVGKTTLTAALATTLVAPEGGRIIALELDSQNTLQYHLGVSQPIPGISQASGDGDWRTVSMQGFSDSHFLPYGRPGEEEQRHLEHNLGKDSAWLAHRVARMNLGEQDVLIINTPAGNSAWLHQVLAIADVIMVVTLADAASYLALEQMDRILAPRLAAAQPPECLYVINQLDASRQFSLDMSAVLSRRLGKRLVGTIHLDHFLSESLAYERNPMEHLPRSQGCEDIARIAAALSRQFIARSLQESCVS